MEKYELISHPTPQFRREDWISLNGEWDFAFDDQKQGEKNKWYLNHNFNRKIIVPYTYETKASGIGDENAHPIVWYRCEFEIPKEIRNKRPILHFNASDYLTKVWIDGHFIGQHQGGYSRFSFDIADTLNTAESVHSLVVMVEDSLELNQPRGKQRWTEQNFGCWYVQTTGIWQTVWMDFVDSTYLNSVKMIPDIDASSVTFEYSLNGVEESRRLQLKTEITFNGELVKEWTQAISKSSEKMTVEISSDVDEWKVKLWHPNHPNLYDVTFTLLKDERVIDQVQSYFGMRKISIEHGQILLNNSPIYQKLLLDQGYWPETHLTPPSEEALILDIDKTLEMGFNGVRKHQKIEDPRYLYWCDKKGVLVWSEMAATYEFRDKAVDQFTKEWLDIVRQNYNHPSIITWTPFNESWGVKNIANDQREQDFTKMIYYLTKTIDPMRPVITNDGWEHTISDIVTLHDYEELGSVFTNRYSDKDNIVNNKIAHNLFKYAFVPGYHYQGQPIILSEYGGIAFKDDEGWGYGNQVANEEAFFERYSAITQAINNCEYISGFCYTQITDVQQEINGLLTEDRKPKVSLRRVKEINQLS